MLMSIVDFEMKVFLKIFIILILLALGSVVTFVSQLYSPTALWVLSFAALVSPIVFGIYINRRSSRLIITLFLSLIIDANFLFRIPYGDPVTAMLLYSLALVTLSWAILFSLAEITASMTPSRICRSREG